MSLHLSILRAANVRRQRIWDPEKKISPEYRGNELAGETGEACNEIKKLVRERMGLRGSRTTKEKLALELADVVICADLVAHEFGIDLSEAIVQKFNETSAKVGIDVVLNPAIKIDGMYCQRCGVYTQNMCPACLNATA